MKRVLITGGTGLIGSRLSVLLAEKGYDVALLSRSRDKDKPYTTYHWDVKNGLLDDEAITTADHIVHLAGANIADGWWTDDRKKLILESRTKSAELLIKKLGQLDHQVKSVVSSSAIGYYGNRGETILTEEDAAGKGFLSEVCVAWERSIQPVQQQHIRLAVLRTGIVMSSRGGALVQMERPLSLGIGAYLGDGKQFYSWIHIDDLCRMYIKAIEDDSMEGVYNAVAPNPVRNKELVETLEKVLDKAAITAPTPAILLRFLLGEMAHMVLDSDRVSAIKIEEKGFRFEFEWLEDALKDIYARKV
ncbi:MAG: TIGR01777 family oxidoreductase [Chitinophagales bacterium]|nr:TIGR01777 family oxidoreductase [Chitinophagales bacterium]